MCILKSLAVLLILFSGALSAAELRFSLVQTGRTISSGEYAWRDGGWLPPAEFNHVAVLIEHRGSRLLFGTGLGRQIDAQLHGVIPWRAKRYSAVQPARDQFDEDGFAIDRVVLGCARWNHASGLVDFAELPVLASPESIRYAQSATPPAVIPGQFSHRVRWQPLRLERRAVYGFGESLDLFGDERLVLVKLAGHGALGLFLTLDDGRRFFFRGDALSSESRAEALPAEVYRLQDVRLQARLGFYPRWVE